ncbi:MAG: histidine phosphatase family protein [Prevotellaceae bacterium]|jgi:probable phosphoglycerate mutase|nr:histidine phosphatase family protein [Prevotellaceae bacterium]
MKRLVIVRHGNTFTPEQIPTRAGAKTDIPLVEEIRSRNAGKYLINNNIIPDKVYAAPLKRTMRTAELIIDEMNLNTGVIADNDFTEIDYGEDENKTEEQVKYRLGMEYVKSHQLTDVDKDEIPNYGNAVIELWNSHAIVPPGWKVDVDRIIVSWKNFANRIGNNETALICTSNGIIRFAPHIMDALSITEFHNTHKLKVSTGSVSIFENNGNGWKCTEWNGL